MAVYLLIISSVHVKCGLMSSKVRLDIASHSISLITIDFYRVWIIQIFKSLLRISRFELSGLHCNAPEGKKLHAIQIALTYL